MEDMDGFARSFRDFMEAMVRQARTATTGPTLFDRLKEHLGSDPDQMAVFGEEFATYDHPNLQVAINARLALESVESELIGVSIQNKRYMGAALSDFIGRPREGGGPLAAQGPVEYVNIHLAGGEVLPCVQFGVYLVTEAGSRLVIFVAAPGDGGGPRIKLRIEVIGNDPERCQAFLQSVTGLMEELNVYRGHVISLMPAQVQFGPTPQSLVQFENLAPVARRELVLPEHLLERIERQTIGFSVHAEGLRAAGISLKRGMLLHGLPGTGKTLTVKYLAGRLEGRTIILTTGRGMGLIQSVARLARALAPAMVVLEDVDLIAEERGMPSQRTAPLLFELLNEMDGLQEDADVIFVLTTNRPDLLEPALAARPGRVDLAVEIPLPDAEGRRRLLELYSANLDVSGLDLADIVEKTEGATPAYIRELLRKSAIVGAQNGHGGVISASDLATALAELAEGGRLAEKLLGYRPEIPGAGGPGSPMGPRPTGFPPGGAWIRQL